MKKVKPKICPVCEKPFAPTHSTTQKVCSPSCALELVRKNPPKSFIKKTAELEQKAIDEKVRKMKANLVKLSDLEKVAKAIFQKWVRLRDEKEPCISCGKVHAFKWDGGHYKKAELYSGVIFHPYNCNKQCSRPCNFDLGGNEANYREGLVKKIGEDNVKELERLSNETRQYKYTREELFEITRMYKAKIKEKDFNNVFV